MQCRNEYDFVALAYLVSFLSFEFPVSIVDQDEDTWATRSLRGRLRKWQKKEYNERLVPQVRSVRASCSGLRDG